MSRRRVWIDPAVVYAVHGEQLAEHGGADGVRDAGAIESALARPRNLAGYGDPDIADLAAAYACGIAEAHGFVDGNKRVAWVVAAGFLTLNGFDLDFEQADGVRVMWGVADGSIDERALAAWFRERLVEL